MWNTGARGIQRCGRAYLGARWLLLLPPILSLRERRQRGKGASGGQILEI